MTDNLNALKQMKIWLCWNFAEKDGRKTKVPVAANGEKTGTNEALPRGGVIISTDKNEQPSPSRI